MRHCCRGVVSPRSVARARVLAAQHAAPVFAATPIVAIAAAPMAPVIAVFAPLIAVIFVPLAVTAAAILHLCREKRGFTPCRRQRRRGARSGEHDHADEGRRGKCDEDFFIWNSSLASGDAFCEPILQLGDGG